MNQKEGDYKMSDTRCPQCGANLTNDYCEYCGWNSKDSVQSKVLKLSGVFSNLSVTKENCVFEPKAGPSTTIVNKEITGLTLIQAPIVGTGELIITSVTGITQKINFIYTQNSNAGEVASYLRQLAPDVQINNSTQNEISANAQGIMCPKCRSNNTVSTGVSRKFSVWKIVVGGLLISMGIGSSPDITFFLLTFLGGAALVANGLRLFGKKKLNCLCMNCRKRFRV